MTLESEHWLTKQHKGVFKITIGHENLVYKITNNTNTHKKTRKNTRKQTRKHTHTQTQTHIQREKEKETI